jgi:hypothetical protein
MTPLESLLPPDLPSSRPGLDSLLRSLLARISEPEGQRIMRELGPRPQLVDLWRASGGGENYGYVVEPFDLDAVGSQDFRPALGDACLWFVRLGRMGRRALLLGLVNHAAGLQFVANAASRKVARHHGFAYAPPKDGIFRAARYLAAVRREGVKPDDLIAIAGIMLTPSLRTALAAGGLDPTRLEQRCGELRADLGRAAVAKLREIVIVPPAFLNLSPSWRLEEVTTTCGLQVVRNEEDLLPDLDAVWLTARYLLYADVSGLPPVRRSSIERPLPSAYVLLRRYGDRGWHAVFAAALRASGLEPWVMASSGHGVDELVSRGLPRLSAERSVQPPALSIDPVERARTEYAEVREALSSRIIGRDVIDRLALLVLAHRRGVSQRILFTGRSGAGKSFMARTVAEVVGVPFYLQDATGLTEAGYRGLNVPDLVSAMHRNAGSDLKALESSVLFLDEMDKTRIGEGVEGVSLDKRWGMQAGLLSLLDGKTPIVADEGSLTVRTAGILMICAGAFSDAPWASERAPTTDDLVRYGLLRELAERLRDRIFLPPRTVGQLAQLLQESDESVEAVVGPLAAELGIELRVLPAAYTVVARMVAEERGGLGPRSGNQLLVVAGQRALLRALQEDSDPVALVTPDDLDLLMGARR